MMIHIPGSKARTRCSLLRDQIWSQLSSSDQTEDGRPQYYKGDNADKDNDHDVTQVTHVYYEECSDHALRIKIDFDEFSSDPIFQVPSSLFIVIIHPQKITFVTYRQALHRDMHIIVVIFVRKNLHIFVYRKT